MRISYTLFPSPPPKKEFRGMCQLNFLNLDEIKCQLKICEACSIKALVDVNWPFVAVSINLKLQHLKKKSRLDIGA